MPFVKVQKNKAYFKRYQVKFRRRREGKTDYYARKRLTMMEKNKYNSHRYRLVVRFTNTRCICQVIVSELTGDRVIAAANSYELENYPAFSKLVVPQKGKPGKTRGIGLKNFAASYATGLLVARRTLTKLGLAEIYEGNTEVDGTVIKCDDEGRVHYVKEVHYSEDGETRKRPLRALLDVGVRRTTTGSRLFSALKGAADGGLDVPHSEKRFVGYDAEGKSYNPEMMRDRIFSDHVTEHMKLIGPGGEDEDMTTYSRQFSGYVKAGIKPEDLEGIYENLHGEIRANPFQGTEKKAFAGKHDVKYKKLAKRPRAQRQDRVAQKKAWKAAQEAGDDEEEEEESDE